MRGSNPPLNILFAFDDAPRPRLRLTHFGIGRFGPHIHGFAMNAPELAFTSVQTTESIASRGSLPLLETRYNEHWGTERRRIYNAMEAMNEPPRRLDAFRECTARGIALRSRTFPAQGIILPKSCHDRFCPHCSMKRSWIIQQNITAALEPRRYRFLTLTLKSDRETLNELIEKLHHSFRRLRSTAEFRRAVDGGIYVVELHRRAHPARWHVHLHAVLDGRFLPQATISAAWLRITGDSHIVDIREIRNPRTTARYICKYVAKGFGLDALEEEEQIKEAITAIKNRKTIGSWGNWAQLSLTRRPASELYSYAGGSERLSLRVQRGCSWAKTALDAMRVFEASHEVVEFLHTEDSPAWDSPPPPIVSIVRDPQRVIALLWGGDIPP